MTDPITQFVDHMRSVGCGPSEGVTIEADDRPHYFTVDGDKRGTKKGSYCLRIEPDGFAFGWVMTHREGVSHAWHSKSSRKATTEQKAEWKRRADAAKKIREEEDARIAAEAATKARAIWSKSRTGNHGYLDRKGCQAYGARVSRGALVVPMWSASGIVGLQFIADDGRKLFLKGSEKKGSYFPIKGDDTMVICEGFATAAAIHRATGHSVIAAFDAGNIKPVAVAMRKKYPDREIIIGADNDQWTVNQKGEAWNPGIDKGQQAAVSIGGCRVVAPQVTSDDPDRPTDWDDIARRDGDEVLRSAFAPPVIDDRPDTMDGWDPDYDAPPSAADVMDVHPMEAIRPLGHNGGVYYFFPRESGQIVDLTASSMGSIQSLQRLAPRGFWDAYYGDDGKANDRKIASMASAHLMAECHRLGVFNPEEKRGVGAWIDGGVPVVNCGDVVVRGEERIVPAVFKGDAVYESGPRVVHLGHDPLSNADANKLRQICSMPQWKKPQFGDMLAGWLVIAPIGGALKWRPHIWITGMSGAGKSTIMDEIVKPTLGDIAIRRDGGTTEAAVRKVLGSSGRPYLLDEAESETMQQRQEMEKIIFLLRRASSGGVVENANASYQIRSCFCMSAIVPRIEKNPDLSRISQLEIEVDKRSDARTRFDTMISLIHETLTTEYSRRLLARTMENLPALLENVSTFSKAASELFGNRRAGDQIGPMVAGAYSLTSTKVITFDAALEWMKRHDWDWHTSVNGDSDSTKLLTHIMTARARFDVMGMSREMTIGEMVQAAADPHANNHNDAVNGLKPYGIKVVEDNLLIANTSPHIRKVLESTPYIPWNRTLGDVQGAHNYGGKAVYFMAGMTQRVTAIPLAAVFKLEEPAIPTPVPMEEWS